VLQSSNLAGFAIAGPDVEGTEIALTSAGDPAGRCTIRLTRRLVPGQAGEDSPANGTIGLVTAGWQLPDGTPARGRFASLVRSNS
jgi:hypothetical protein